MNLCEMGYYVTSMGIGTILGVAFVSNHPTRHKRIESLGWIKITLGLLGILCSADVPSEDTYEISANIVAASTGTTMLNVWMYNHDSCV